MSDETAQRQRRPVCLQKSGLHWTVPHVYGSREAKRESPVDQEQQQPEIPVLVSCTSWSGPGRICRYTWPDGTVEWFTEADVHQKGRGRATRPE